MTDLSHTENTWKYITVPDKPVSDKITKSDPIEKSDASVNSAASPLCSSAVKEIPKIKSSIAKYVKVLTAEEKQMAFNNEIASERNDKPTVLAQNQKPKPKNDITKFIFFGGAASKKAENESIKSNELQNAVSIDLTEDNSNPLSGSPDKPVCETERPNSQQSGNKPITTTANSPSASKNTPNKSINVLVPRKIPRSPTVNKLIPKKTPSRPSTLTNSEMPPPKTFNFHEIKSQTNTFAPKRLLESLNKTDPPKPVNVLVPRRANDVKNSDNSKPVNVLIPKRASDMKNASKTDGNSSGSKPVNVLIPRKAGGVKKNHSESSEPEKAKDFAQDDASTDFSLCIESNDGAEKEITTESVVVED